MDATADVIAPNTICFSVNRIANKVMYENAFVAVLALAAHEVSHLIGTSEFEADQLQLMTQSLLTKRAEDNFSRQRKNLIEELDNYKTAIETSIQTVKDYGYGSVRETDVCIELTNQIHGITAINNLMLDMLQSAGVSFTSTRGYGLIVSLYLKSISATMWCYSDSHSKKIEYKNYFGGKNSELIKNIWINSFKGSEHYVFDNVSLNFVTEKDNSAAIRELTEIKSLIQELEVVSKNPYLITVHPRQKKKGTLNTLKLYVPRK